MYNVQLTAPFDTPPGFVLTLGHLTWDFSSLYLQDSVLLILPYVLLFSLEDVAPMRLLHVNPP